MNRIFFLVISLIITSNLIAQNSSTHINMKMDKEQKKEYKQKKAEWFKRLHSIEPDVNYKIIDKETRQSKYKSKQLNKNNSALKVNDIVIANGQIEGEWIERGSDNLAGRIHISDIDFEENLIYSGSAGGNIWRGTLDGRNWVSLNDGLQFDNIRSVKVLRFGNTKRIFAVADKYVYYSDNEGVDWIKSKGLENVENWGAFKRAIYTNSNPTMIYTLGSEWDYDNWKSITTIYKSSDYGVSFKKIYSTDIGVSYCDLWTSIVENRDIVFLAKDTISVIEENDIITTINAFELDFSFNFYEGFLLQGTDAAGFLYLAAKMSNSEFTYFYRSSDYGSSWSNRGNVDFKPFDNNSFAVSSSNSNMLFFGGVNLSRSTDGGVTWTLVNYWWDYYEDIENKLHADIPGVSLFVHNNKEIMLIGTDGGLYYSDNYTNNVQNIALNGMNVSQYYGIYTCKDEKRTLCAGSQDQGFQKCIGYSGTKANFLQTISGDYGHLSSSNGGDDLWCVYPGFAMYYKGIYKDEIEFTATWDFQGKGGLWMPPIVADPTNPEIAWLAGGGDNYNSSYIWKIENNGGILIGRPYSFNFSEGDEWQDLSAFAFSPLDKNTCYALTSNGKFFVSNDAAVNWEKTIELEEFNAHYFYGNCIAPSNLDFGKVFISGSGYSNSSVYMTTDNGKNFIPLDNGLPNTLVFEIALTEDEMFIFAATEVGPYLYSFYDSTWYDIAGYEAPDQTYWTVEYIPELKTARFGTYGRGIWDFKISKINDVKEYSHNSKKLDLFIYPNPMKEILNININSNLNSNLTVKIYDLEGKVIKNLMNNQPVFSDLVLKWDGTNEANKRAAKGNYILIVSCDGFTKYAKIVLD